MAPDPNRPLTSVPMPAPSPEVAASALAPIAFPTLANAALKLSTDPVIPVVGKLEVSNLFPPLLAANDCGLQKTQPIIWIKIVSTIQFIVIAIRFFCTTALDDPVNEAFYTEIYKQN